MRALTKIVSAGTSFLVALAGLAVVTPTSLAAPSATKVSYSGSTTITFDKSLKAIANRIVVVAPAEKEGYSLTFPVVGVEGNGILLAGGTRAGTDPVMTTKDNGTGSVSLTVNGASVEVFTIKNWAVHHTSKKGNVTTQVWHGNLYLTKNQVVVDGMNAGAGKNLFKVGQGLGTIRATVKATKG